MPDYTLCHWGLYEIGWTGDRRPILKPFAGDPEPNLLAHGLTDPNAEALRVLRPAIRAGWLRSGGRCGGVGRGKEPFVEVPWDEALDLSAQALAKTRDEHGNEAIFGGSYGWASAGRFHHAQSQVHRFLNCVGGYVSHRDSYSLGAANALMPYVVAPMDELMKTHTSWELLAENTQLFVAFGGLPRKNSQVTAGGVGSHRLRDALGAMARRGVRFVNIGPVRDNLETGAEVEWIACRPNTDTALMLAIAHTLETEGMADLGFISRYCTGYDRFRDYLTGRSDGIAKNAAWAEAITTVPADRIVRLAREMASQATMLNIAWSLQRAEHGEQPYWMLVTLAAMLGQIGTPGGGFGVGYGAMNSLGHRHRLIRSVTLPQGDNPVSRFIPVARLSDMLLSPGADFVYQGRTYQYPDIRLIYWAGGNPFHHHQDLNRLRRAWAKPETVIVNEQYWTATAKHSDIVLPVTTTLERDDIGSASGEGVIVAMKRQKDPPGEARDDYDIFAGIAGRLGARQTFTQGRDSSAWLEHLYELARLQNASEGVEMPDFPAFWRNGLVDHSTYARAHVMLEAFIRNPERNPLSTASGQIEIASDTISAMNLPDCPGHPVWRGPREYLGATLASTFPFHLLSDQPTGRLHSQLDPAAASRAGKVAGREPVHMHPRDAAERGIRAGDIVELFNGRGRCLAGAVLNSDLMPGVVRMSTGAWFDPDPSSDLERHGNPNVLTADVAASAFSQGCSAQSCLVDIRKWRQAPPSLAAFDPPEFAN